MKQTKTQNSERHVRVWTSFLHSLKSITKTLFLFAYKFFSSLQVFKLFAVSEQRVDFCEFPNCQYHLLIHDESTDMSSFSIVFNCDFSYQSVDCSFITFRYYFHCITQNKGLVIQKLLSAFDFHRFLQFPVLTVLRFTKKRLLREKFRSKRKLSRKNFLSFSRTDNVRSNINTMRALKNDEDGPGFPLEEYSKHFVQVYLISLLLRKQRFRIFTRKLSQPNWYWTCISLPFFLQRHVELFSESGFWRLSCQNCEYSEKYILINLLEEFEWKIQF